MVERINDIQKMDADTKSVLFNVIDTYIQNFKTKQLFIIFLLLPHPLKELCPLQRKTFSLYQNRCLNNRHLKIKFQLRPLPQDKTVLCLSN